MLSCCITDGTAALYMKKYYLYTNMLTESALCSMIFSFWSNSILRQDIFADAVAAAEEMQITAVIFGLGRVA